MIEEPEILFEEESHTYTANGIKRPSVTTILSGLGFIDFSMVPLHLLEAAQVRGRAVHDCIQFIEEDDLDWSTVHETLRPYLEAFMLFRDQSGFKSTVREKKVFSDVLNYCGRLDALGSMTKLGIEEALLDYKSGAPQPATRYQLAAYAVAESKPAIPRFSLHLQKTGKYKLIHHKDFNDIAHWKAIVTAYHVKASLNGGK